MSNNLDHISRAVEKARQERKLITGRRAAPESLKKLAYNNIRTIKVSKDLLREKRIILSEDKDHDSECINTYKRLRTAVLHRLRQNGWNTFGITSSTPGEGKTLTAINLSIQLSMEANHTVLLVDADLRHPSVHRYFGYMPVKGLADYLLSGVSVEEILIHPAIEHLIVLPGGKPIRNSSESLSSPKMAALVKELKTCHSSQLVVFDLPPLLFSDDVMAFSPCLDAFLLVIEDGKVAHDELAHSIDLLESTNLLGTVLNKAQEKEAGYSTYYYNSGKY